MSNFLSDRVNSLSESQTIAMARRSRELISQGYDIINLSLGEPDFNTPDPIKDAAKEAIDGNFSYYTHVAGYLELRQAIARKFKRDNDLHFTADQIVVSTGAKQCIANAVLSVVNPGDDVLVPAPYWVSYLEIIKLAGGNAIVIPTTIESNFKVTGEQISKAITPKTKLLLYSSPCNPTGTVYNRSELESIARAVEPKEDIFIISDEIYEYIIFDQKHESMAQFDFIRDRVITINGVSKSFAMTGWRVGYLAAALPVAKACDKMQGQFTSATCSIAQRAAHAAVDMDLEFIAPMRDAFKRRRDVVLEKLSEIPGIKLNDPHGAFYFFPEVSYYFGKKNGDTVIKDATDLCMYLLDKAKVAIVPGDAFGDDKCIRFSYAASEERLREAIERMKVALSELN